MKRKNTYGLLFMSWGAFFGLGAPLGALVARSFFLHTGPFPLRLLSEWTGFSFFYTYMTVGTVLAFGAFGFLIGRQTDLLEEEKEAVNTLAITDGLTDVYNHRYLQERLAIGIEEARRYKVPLACMMLDLDDFKRINDQHGHPFGDLVLRRIAKLIRENTRHLDVVGRYGGEEFLVIMPHTTAQEALPIAERVRRTIAAHPFNHSNIDIQVTISIGIADYGAKGLSHRDRGALLRAADEALYQAKHGGKNQIVVWQGPLQVG